MRGINALMYLLAGIFLVNLASAATIYGNVYDLSLKQANNARIEINTAPKQFFVAQNGSYSFEVPNGFYRIKAQIMQKGTIIASVEENITVKQDGSYVLDLILFPDIEEGVENADIDVNLGVIETEKKQHNILDGLAILSILAAIFMGVYYLKKNKKQQKEKSKNDEEIKKVKKEAQKEEAAEQKEPFDEELKKLIETIKKEGNRTTQKEIRKQIPLSEAKISLMIAELEHKGVIEKIKKGRGNIIILKRQ